MKILKVELQNINSLKSDNPIVIDFEKEAFKDVGLYAITGATGAGKTTVLDAITIALYQSVPRFKANKGTLTDVVSFGAHDAFSRVTFENNNIIYEGYWGIRVANARGPLVNPVEIVTLKNLTSGETIAEQKRVFGEKIIEVTQLDYTQFLRSVMLAQGEFASFLSAKGPEKGKLLEQITGEEIYKKIGQYILDRKGKEFNKLVDIENTVNEEDTLKDEERLEYTNQQIENKQLITVLEKELKSLKEITDWFTQLGKLKLKEEQVGIDESDRETLIETHKNDMRLLAMHEKANQFKDLLQSIARNEGARQNKTKQLLLLGKDLDELKPEIVKLQTVDETNSESFKNWEKEDKSWGVKFHEIVAVEADIKNKTENKVKSEERLKGISEVLNVLNETAKTLDTLIQTQDVKLKSANDFITEHQNLSKVENQISRWTTDLITLKSDKNILFNDNQFVLEKQEIISKTTTEIEEGNKKLEVEQQEINEIEKKNTSTSKSLEKLNSMGLLPKKERLNVREKKLESLKQYAQDYTNLQEEKSNKILIYKKTLADEIVLEKDLAEGVKLLTVQGELLEEKERSLALEKSIKNYEDDRKKLKEGEACTLCGSVDHPFVKHSMIINISKCESELFKIKEKHLKLTTSKNEVDKLIGINKNEIKNINSQLNEIDSKIGSIKTKASSLDVKYKLSDIAEINTQLILVKSEVAEVQVQLEFAQELQLKKDKLLTSIQEKTVVITSMNTGVNEAKQRIIHNNNSLITKQKSITVLTKSCSALESDLSSRLALLDYNVPTVENTSKFIADLQENITLFNSNSKELVDLENQKSKSKLEITTTQKAKDSNTKDQLSLIEQISEIDEQLEVNTAKRNAILPSEISIDEKRNALIKEKEILIIAIEKHSKYLQNQLTLQAEKVVLVEQNATDQKKQINELEALNKSFNTKLRNSEFESKEDVCIALLDKESEDSKKEIERRIDKEKIKLATVKSEIKKDLKSLNQKKYSDINESEIHLKSDTLNKSLKDLITTLGGIDERFRKDNEIRDRNKDIYVKLDKQSTIYNTWKVLFGLIGNSKDSFNTYVQRFTLQNLLELANIHLYSLNKRYSLKMESSYKKGEELNFNLIDHYQTSQSRLVDTSSGGEKFIISLALALGLSDLASKNVKIDSLFIDEGFGTLDNNTLETVISTLETLQSQGKKIGIRTHIENLKERLPTQNQIKKKSNGVSSVDIV